MSTENLFPSPCYIVVVGGASGLEGQRLTDGEGHVTISPPNAVPDIRQEWQITLGDEGNIAIRRPGDFVPTPYLTYDGAPEVSKEGDRVVLNDFPSVNEWHAKLEPGPTKVRLRVPNSELGVAIAPPTIYPPFLELSLKGQLEWAFIAVPPPEE